MTYEENMPYSQRSESLNWIQYVRETGLVEWVYTHGVGHPDVDSANALAAHYGHTTGMWLSHGCDGCCGAGAWVTLTERRWGKKSRR